VLGQGYRGEADGSFVCVIGILSGLGASMLIHTHARALAYTHIRTIHRDTRTVL